MVGKKNLQLGPSRAGEIWKRRFLTTVRPTVRSNPPGKPRFSKTYLKTPAFVLQWVENIFKTELFVSDGVRVIMLFLLPSFLQTQIQNKKCVLKCLRHSVNGD